MRVGEPTTMIGRQLRVALLIAALVLGACSSDEIEPGDDAKDRGSSSRCKGQVIHDGQLYEFWTEADKRGAPLGEVETAKCFDMGRTNPPVSERGSGSFVKAYTLPGVDDADAFMTQRFGITDTDTGFFVFARIDASPEVLAQLPERSTRVPPPTG